jgi:hypothetical protein
MIILILNLDTNFAKTIVEIIKSQKPNKGNVFCSKLLMAEELNIRDNLPPRYYNLNTAFHHRQLSESGAKRYHRNRCNFG